jgi:hypothetical protein
MEWSMKQISERRSRPRIGKALGVAAVALLCLGAFSQPNPAYAEPHGGGGFHGGGFHAGAVGGFHGGGFRPGFGDRRFNGGFGGLWGGYYPYDGEYDAVQPSYSQTWYYCSDPAGYYPYVTQCTTGWQAVPAS